SQFVGAVRGPGRQHGVGPAEVVETGDMAQAAANGDDVADRLVDGTGGHVIGINVAVARADAVGNNDALHRVEQRAQDGRVTRTVVVFAHQGLDDASRLYFVVVLPNDPLFAADVEAAQHLHERRGEISWAGKGGFRMARRLPVRRQPHLGQTVV